ncbi:MAG: DUF7694 domain-containing protein [Gammaproteobacteria bacterium]
MPFLLAPAFDRGGVNGLLLGEEFEAVELYPAERDLVDAKAHYHLWAFTAPGDTFGMGFGHGREVRGNPE